MAVIAPAWVDRIFSGDRISRQAFTFLSPEFDSRDLGVHDGTFFGPKIEELGAQLRVEGSLPGLQSFEPEESPEFRLSLDLWGQAVEEESSKSFDSLVQACFLQAEAAFGTIGRLAPRLAALRWCCCMCWLGARSSAVEAASAGGSFGTVDKASSLAACKEAKSTILGWLRDLIKEAPVMAVFDFDLVGHGVWHSQGREPVPPEAFNEWWRRGVEYDIVRMCTQAMQLPPEELNSSAPLLHMVQPLGQLDLYLLPPEIPRRIIDRHGWFAVVRPAPIDQMPAKAYMPGPILDMDIPPEPEFDFDNAEIIAKVQRGEDLGKGHQEDGLPGAVHGSVGLLYAAMCATEKLEHIHFSKGLLELTGFVEHFLRYSPPLRVLDFSGCAGSVSEECLSLLGLAGRSVAVLDLSDCELDGSFLKLLVEALVELKGLTHLDLAGNSFDQESVVTLMIELTERRIDIGVVRLDENPIGEADLVQEVVAQCLAERGMSTVAGGDLVLHLGETAVRWAASPEVGQPLQRLRDGSDGQLRLTSLKELRQHATSQKRRLDEFEELDPAAQTQEGQDWLQQQRKMNASILDSDLMQIYRRELAARAKSDRGPQA